jgi:hypothetical protein
MKNRQTRAADTWDILINRPRNVFLARRGLNKGYVVGKEDVVGVSFI